MVAAAQLLVVVVVVVVGGGGDEEEARSILTTTAGIIVIRCVMASRLLVAFAITTMDGCGQQRHAAAAQPPISATIRGQAREEVDRVVRI